MRSDKGSLGLGLVEISSPSYKKTKNEVFKKHGFKIFFDSKLGFFRRGPTEIWPKSRSVGDPDPPCHFGRPNNKARIINQRKDEISPVSPNFLIFGSDQRFYDDIKRFVKHRSPPLAFAGLVFLRIRRPATCMSRANPAFTFRKCLCGVEDCRRLTEALSRLAPDRAGYGTLPEINATPGKPTAAHWRKSRYATGFSAT